MRKSRFTEEQIIKVLKEHAAGLSAGDLCRKHGISAATRFARTQAREMAAASKIAARLVMIKNMLFWDQDAAALAEKLTAVFSGEADPDRRRELLKSIEPLPTAHERSQRCALDAVRYVHPKLEEIAWANSNFQSYHSRAGWSPVDTRDGSRLGGL